MSKTISFTVDKECKGARRYKEVAPEGQEIIGTVYIKRSSDLTQSDVLRVTIEAPGK